MVFYLPRLTKLDPYWYLIKTGLPCVHTCVLKLQTRRGVFFCTIYKVGKSCPAIYLPDPMLQPATKRL